MTDFFAQIIGLPACEGTTCTLCDLFQLFQNIINWLTTIVFPLAVAVIVYGAFLMIFSGGSPERVAAGRKAIQAAIIGIVIALFAWVMINVIINILTGASAWPWNTIQC